MKFRETKIIRRSFIKYLLAAGAGIYFMAEHPIKIIKEKFNKVKQLKPKENPFAVKRNKIING